MKKTKTCTLYVAGMHCSACEVLLEKKISKLDGVVDVNADLSQKNVTLQFESGHVPHIDTLNNEFKDLGYTFTENPAGEGALTYQNAVQVVAVFIFLILAFIIFQDLQIFEKFALNEQSTYPAFFALGVIASISSCAALTGGLLLSLTKQWTQLYGGVNESKRIVPIFLFNIGRLVSFALLGGILGYIGSFFHISLQFTAVFVLFVSLIMLTLGLQMAGVSWAKKIRLGFPRFLSRFASHEEQFHGKYMPIIVGALTFFLPCGFTLMAQSIALTTGNPLTSALMMLSFAVGTLPVLWFIGFSSISLQKNRSFSQTFNLVAGVLIVLFGLYNINSQLNVLGLPSLNDLFPKNTLAVTENIGVRLVGSGQNQYQEVVMEARGFEYFPSVLKLKAGVPVRLTVRNNDAIGCAAAMYWPGIYDKVIFLDKPVVTAEFTPQTPGSYKVSCTMGMVPPVKVLVE